ncbi:MAG TPA: T9SS type B sorting domain-containing protein [Eudoraea sp.]|nr:T9SS type B sorting domain-containing protein [Eudoraea sp.]
MKKIASVLLFGILCPVFVLGQGETSNWYFGKGAGIHFNNNGSVTAVEKSNINTFEGCATISDTFGNLLFYTDGITVYNRTHEIMEGGTGLYGDSSSTQSALIVPKPEDPDIFYIFTVDTAVFPEDPDFGLNYSVVDISANNGNGAVIEKNTNLLAKCSEKITAVVKDCFDKSIWVITLASEQGDSEFFNTFHAFEVNALGVTATATKTTFRDLSVQDPRGYLKLSSDGTKLVCANSSSGLYLYDFNALTGIVSNQQPIGIPGPNQFSYGVEFSPNNQLLYVHSADEIQRSAFQTSQLLQYDMTAADISGSAVILDSRSIFRGALQLGENGKIYRTIARSYALGTPFLGVINKPNELGMAADYQHNAIDLNGRDGTQGLPPFIQSFFGKSELIKNDDGTGSSTLALCTGDPFILEAEMIPGAIYAWEKDGIPFNAPVGNRYEVLISDVADSGKYSVEITSPDATKCHILGQALIKVIPTPDESISLTLCDIDPQDSTDGITVVNLKKANDDPDIEFFFYESTADRDNDLPITEPEQYRNTRAFNQTLYYKAVNQLGCTNEGEIELQVDPVVIAPSPFGPFYSCDESVGDDVLTGTFALEDIAQNYSSLTVSFYIDLADAALEQNPLNGSITTSSTVIYAKLENAGKCLGVEAIEFIVNPSPAITMEASYQLCTDGDGLSINAPEGFDSYRWIKTGAGTDEQISGQQHAVLTELGNYILEVGFIYNINGETMNCSNSAAFNLTPSNKAVIEDVLIDDFSNNNTVQVEVSGDGTYEFSLDGTGYQASNYFENVTPGFITLFVRDLKGCGTTEREIAVMGYPKFFTPNGDGVNDFWQLTGINDLFQPDAFIAIYDRFGSFVTQIQLNEGGWDGAARSRALPASDYWFSVSLKDGRELRGHFALKR